MPKYTVTNFTGINLYLNPLLQASGELIRSINVDNYPIGAKTKRFGYSEYGDNPDSAEVKSVFNWTKEDGTSYNYRASGSLLYYKDVSGTAGWEVCENGTIPNGAVVRHAVLEDTLIIVDGGGTTRHTTDGTAFTDTSGAPAGVDVTQFERRIYIAGTNNFMFYSVSNDPTNWQTTGTSDSSSIKIPGEGSLTGFIKQPGELWPQKSSGNYFRWDGYSLVDSSSKVAPSSIRSVATIESFNFWMNRLGLYSSGGSRPQLMSNKVQGQIYNIFNDGVAGTLFPHLASGVYRYNYFTSLGTVTDDFTRETMSNTLLKYDMRQDSFDNYVLADYPTAFGNYVDSSGDEKFLFGDNTGQVYEVNSSYGDNGEPITALMEGFIHLGSLQGKYWNEVWAAFNPGCQAKIQVAVSDAYHLASKRWVDLGDTSRGVVEFRFPEGDNYGKFLFFRISERSADAPFTFYGFELDVDIDD